MATSTPQWPDLGRFWTVPNALSLARLVLVVPITALLWQDGSLAWLFGLVMLAIMTDWFDGRVARWLQTESEWGKVLDPIADKIGAVATISALTFRSADPHLPLWFFGTLVGRDLLILAGSTILVRRSGRVVASAWAGKAATFWLAITVLAAVLKADPPVMQFCVWMTTAMLVISFGVYVVRYLNAVSRTPPPSGGEPSASDEAPSADAETDAKPDAEPTDAPTDAPSTGTPGRVTASGTPASGTPASGTPTTEAPGGDGMLFSAAVL